MIVFVSTSGCIGLFSDAPTKQTTPVTFVGNNTIEESHTFEVFVLKAPTTLNVSDSYNRSYTSEVNEGLAIRDPGEGHFTNVEPQAGRHHGNFTLGGNESVESDIHDLPVGFAILVVVYDTSDRIIGYVWATCDDLDMSAIGVTAHSQGLTGDIGCV